MLEERVAVCIEVFRSFLNYLLNVIVVGKVLMEIVEVWNEEYY